MSKADGSQNYHEHADLEYVAALQTYKGHIIAAVNRAFFSGESSLLYTTLVACRCHVRSPPRLPASVTRDVLTYLRTDVGDHSAAKCRM